VAGLEPVRPTRNRHHEKGIMNDNDQAILDGYDPAGCLA